MGIQMRGGNELIDPVKVLEQGGIAQGFVVADLGCGTAGHFVFPAAHMVGRQGKVYAVDVQKSVLAAIVSRGKIEGVDNVETVWADLERAGTMKIADNSVDLSLLLNTIFQIKDRPAVLREAARVTKHGASLIIVDWKITGAPFGPATSLRVDKTLLRSQTEEAGFEFVREFEPGPYHFGMVFKRR